MNSSMRYFVNQVLTVGENTLRVEARPGGAPANQVALFLNDEPATPDDVWAAGFFPMAFNNYAWAWRPR